MNNQVGKTLKISLEVLLDPIDMQITKVMSQNRALSVYQLRTILEYQRLFIGYHDLATRLKFLSLLSLVERQETSRHYKYRLTQDLNFD